MKEEDIDKLFREALGNDRSTVTDSDWKTFESQLPKRRGGWLWIGLVALLIAVTSAAGFFYFAGGEMAYTPRTISDETKLSSTHLSDVKFEVSEASSTTKQFVQTNNESQNSDNTGSTKVAQNPSETGAIKNDEVASKEVGNSRSGINQAMNSVPDGSENKSTPVSSQSSSIGSGNDFKDGTGSRSSTQGGKTLTVAAGSQKSANPSTSVPDNSEEKESIELIFSPEEMAMLEAEAVDRNSTPKMEGDKREITPIKTKPFSPYIYFKMEQNSILKTSVGIGLGIEKSFGGPSPLSFRGGIGYLRSGDLNWKQSATGVTFGFDQYLSQSELTTTRIDLVQIPLHLNWNFGGVNRLCGGIESSFIINASQELDNFDDLGPSNLPESGYLYDTGAPEFMYFLQLGYGRMITERFELEVGGSYSPQNWIPSEDTPASVYFKINYFIR